MSVAGLIPALQRSAMLIIRSFDPTVGLYSVEIRNKFPNTVLGCSAA